MRKEILIEFKQLHAPKVKTPIIAIGTWPSWKLHVMKMLQTQSI